MDFEIIDPEDDSFFPGINESFPRINDLFFQG